MSVPETNQPLINLTQSDLAQRFGQLDFLSRLNRQVHTLDFVTAEADQIIVRPTLDAYLGASAVVSQVELTAEVEAWGHITMPLLPAFSNTRQEIDKQDKSLVHDEILARRLHRAGVTATFQMVETAAALPTKDLEVCLSAGRDLKYIVDLMKRNFYTADDLAVITGEPETTPRDRMKALYGEIAPGNRPVEVKPGHQINRGFKIGLTRSLHKLEQPASNLPEQPQAVDPATLLSFLASLDTNAINDGLAHEAELVAELVSTSLKNVKSDNDMVRLVIDSFGALNVTRDQFVDKVILGFAKYLAIKYPKSPGELLLTHCQDRRPTEALMTLAEQLGGPGESPHSLFSGL